MHPDLQEAIDFHVAVLAEGSKALVGYDTAKAVANVVLLSEIPTTYDKRSERQVNAGNLLLRGVPGVGKTFFGVILVGDQRREVRAHPGPRRSAADRGGRLPDDQSVDRPADDRVRPDGVGRSDPARRDQPHPAQVAKRVSRGAAGPHDHGRQDHLRSAGVQLRDRDDEPGGAGAGHVSAVGSGDRSLRGDGQHRLPAAGRRREAGELRLQAGAPQRRCCRSSASSSCAPRSTSRCSCTSGSAATSSGWWPRRGRTTPTPTGTQHSPSELVERGVDLGASPRAIICWSRLAKVWALLQRRRAEVYPEDIQDLAPFVLGHRIWLGPHAAAHGLTPEAVIRDVIDQVPIP